jgi:sugar O-acyltransferase (sialic acid O-acetyltransferase NeuD family)
VGQSLVEVFSCDDLKKYSIGNLMSTKRIVILGGPGDGVVVAQAVRDLAKAGREVSLFGFLNDRLEKGEHVFGDPVLGTLQAWQQLPQDVCFVPALHKVCEMVSRAKLILGLGIPDYRWTSVVHPTACVADDISIGYGSFIASHVTIQPGADVGKFVSVRAGANIGHDATVADFSYIGPNATLSGRARLEEGVHLAPNAAVMDDVVVGKYSVVGLGSAVMKNVEEFSVYLGNPARKLRTLGSGKDVE